MEDEKAEREEAAMVSQNVPKTIIWAQVPAEALKTIKIAFDIVKQRYFQ